MIYRILNTIEVRKQCCIQNVLLLSIPSFILLQMLVLNDMGGIFPCPHPVAISPPPSRQAAGSEHMIFAVCTRSVIAPLPLHRLLSCTHCPNVLAQPHLLVHGCDPQQRVKFSFMSGQPAKGFATCTQRLSNDPALIYLARK